MISTILNSIKIESQVYSATRNLKSLSNDVLKRVLSGSVQSLYGQQYKISKNISLSDFKASVPITQYENYRLWIERIMAGERDVLWPSRPISFVSTSGTTASAKIIPITREFLDDYHLDSRVTYHRLMLRNPGLIFGKILAIGGPAIERMVNGIPIGSITGLLYSTLPEPIYSRLLLDSKIYDLPSFEDKLYLISRLALEAKLAGIITVIPGTLLVLEDEINRRAEQLIWEIETGKISRINSVPPHLLERISHNLRPNKSRANNLKKALSRDGKLLPKNIWPLKFLCTYMKEIDPHQWKKIEYLFGDLSIIDPGIVASEGRISIGYNANCVSSALIPSASFIEFLPWDHLNDFRFTGNRTTYLPDELDIGKHYIPIISNRNGFLRYMTGDIVKVTKRHSGIPFAEFIGRIDNCLSAAGEKMTEVHFREAVSVLDKSANFEIGSWAVGIEWKGAWPHYVFIYESEQEIHGIGIQMEKQLRKLNVSYDRKRSQRLLSPLTAIKRKVGAISSSHGNIKWFGQSKQKRFYESRDSEFRRLLKVG